MVYWDAAIGFICAMTAEIKSPLPLTDRTGQDRTEGPPSAPQHAHKREALCVRPSHKITVCGATQWGEADRSCGEGQCLAQTCWSLQTAVLSEECQLIYPLTPPVLVLVTDTSAGTNGVGIKENDVFKEQKLESLYWPSIRGVHLYLIRWSDMDLDIWATTRFRSCEWGCDDAIRYSS